MRISIQFLNERYYLIVVSLQFLFDSKGSISFRKKICKKKFEEENTNSYIILFKIWFTVSIFNSLKIIEFLLLLQS